VAHRVTFLDVFTDTPLAGNGLAVVHDADDVDDETMQRFAIETRLAETTFVQSPREPDADYRNRIFTVNSEIPFAGHPSLGTAVAVARASGETEASYVQETRVGLQPIEVRIDGDQAGASMLQGPTEFGDEIDPAKAMAAVGLDPAEAHRELTPQHVSTGLPTAIALVSEERSLSRATPDFDLLDELLGGPVPNFYLVWWDPEAERAQARMFSSGVVGGEDPATGSAAGPLCAYLAKRAGATRVEITQGVEMGRPALLSTEIEGDQIRVGGAVVPIVDGEVRLT
jgi:trans-2,3-dihydro-3-hydroxyanthranilate isomerase